MSSTNKKPKKRRKKVDKDIAAKDGASFVEGGSVEERLTTVMMERQLALESDEKTLLVWQALERPFKKRGREFFSTVLAIVFLLSIILFFAREFLLIAVIWALTFVSYVFATVKPTETEHRITTRGVRTGGYFFRWDELGIYWFDERFGEKMVLVETNRAFPKVLVMLLGGRTEVDMKKTLGRFLVHEVPEPGFVDKASEWLSEKVPLEE